MRLILASSSPRRAEILRNAGFTFQSIAPDLDETPLPNESPATMVQRLSRLKANVVASHASQPVLVVAADTTVVLGDQSFSKPTSPEEARHMLEQLSGNRHQILTGVSVLRSSDGARRDFIEATTVHFLKISADEIVRYVASGEPFDKAGGYGIQGYASRYVSRVEGCYFNVMGLPVSRVAATLLELGYSETTAVAT
jgi:septum formation protein